MIRLLRSLAVVSVMTLLAAVAACSPGTAGDSGQIQLRIAWWGSDSRTAATRAALDLYTERNPEVTFQVESSGFTGYFDKLGTQTAAGDAPDIVQMQYLHFSAYAQRGSLVTLDDYAPQPIRLDAFDQVIEHQGVLDGQRFALPTGANTQTVVVATDAFAEAGVAIPDADWSWDQFETVAQQLIDSGVVEYASGEFTTADWMFDFWLTQRGGTFYTEDGELGFSAADLEEFWAWGAELREKKYLPPMSLSTEVSELETYPVATGAAAMDFVYSAQITGLSEASGSAIEALPFPQGDHPAQYAIGTGLAWVIMSDSEHPDVAADVIAFLTTDVEAIKLQGMERGAPFTADGRAALAETATGANAKTIEFTEQILQAPMAEDSIFYNRPPLGASLVTTLFTNHAQAVGFGEATPREAAEAFVEAADQELSFAE